MNTKPSTAITEVDPELAAPSLLDEMWASVIALTKDPTVEHQKFSAMLAEHRQTIIDKRDQDFEIAMALCSAEMPEIGKDEVIRAKNGDVMSRYANFDTIDRIVKPIAAGHGLHYRFNPQGDENGRKLLVSCLVTHLGPAGAMTKEFGPMPLAIDESGAKNATQGAGSSTKYGMRYTLQAAFNIRTVGGDTDGNATEAAATPAQTALIESGQRAAQKGMDSYRAWFQGKDVSKVQRGWLVDQGHHRDNKDAAETFDKEDF